VYSRVITLPLAAYVSHAWLSMLQCPTRLALLATTGFPCVTSPCLLREMLIACDRQTASFSVRGLFCCYGTDGRMDARPLQ